MAALGHLHGGGGFLGLAARRLEVEAQDEDAEQAVVEAEIGEAHRE